LVLQTYSDDFIPEPSKLHTAAVGMIGRCLAHVVMARQRYTCSTNIHSVGSMSTLSIAMKSLKLRLHFVCYIRRSPWKKFLTFHFTTLLIWNCRVLRVIRHFETQGRRHELCALCFPPWPDCLFTPGGDRHQVMWGQYSLQPGLSSLITSNTTCSQVQQNSCDITASFLFSVSTAVYATFCTWRPTASCSTMLWRVLHTCHRPHGHQPLQKSLSFQSPTCDT
jgi:hypothetical protein